ncbi:MAG: thioesterase [Candidatus Koribacter versatilis]|uniref:Thioesterase n=1 Tax=Candidatus Korobacter versatilis TaxID=658062 RepID=A0A932EPH2_9BACT|nr:thioesterase [Candidatus Koribacter versatilis]
MKEVPIGARAHTSETVEHKHTLTHHHAELPPVYSTPDMVRLMETACFHALMPFHEPGEINVGTAIHVEHRAATGVGVEVHAEAVMESFDGRFYTMRVRAWTQDPKDTTGEKELGRGTISRAVVHVPTFLAKTKNGKP